MVPTSATAHLLVVLSDESAAYQEVVEELRAKIATVADGRRRIDVRTAQSLADIDDAILRSSELVVTAGLAAAQAVIAREGTYSAPPPTLCLLIPRQSFERLPPPQTGSRDRRLSAVFIDQPIARQLDLVRLALPDKSRVGVILGPTSGLLKDELRDRARERGLELRPGEAAAQTDVYATLQRILAQSDLILSLPDPVTFNSSTAYGVLLTSYRAQIPVVGFSESLVKAGALLSLFSTARQQGRQGGEIAAGALMSDGRLPPPQYPRYFTVRVNASVARSLGIQIEDEAALAASIAARASAVGDADSRSTESTSPRRAQ